MSGEWNDSLPRTFRRCDEAGEDRAVGEVVRDRIIGRLISRMGRMVRIRIVFLTLMMMIIISVINSNSSSIIIIIISEGVSE